MERGRRCERESKGVEGRGGGGGERDKEGVRVYKRRGGGMGE